ncbi:MAG: metalloregulator ArsR/SmtB family transcription factor [Oscillospiraceae bacterium]
MEEIDYTEKAALLKALAHPVRLRIVHTLLREGCHNVGCIERGTGMSQSCISQHLNRLRAVGAVTAERQGNEVYYHASPALAGLIAALLKEEENPYAG